jgi:hypothetical protein
VIDIETLPPHIAYSQKAFFSQGASPEYFASGAERRAEIAALAP